MSDLNIVNINGQDVDLKANGLSRVDISFTVFGQTAHAVAVISEKANHLEGAKGALKAASDAIESILSERFSA